MPFKNTVLTLFFGTTLMNFSITDALANNPLTSHFPEMQMSAVEKKVLTNLQAAYPHNGVRFVRQSPVPGLFEVILSTSVNVVYVDEALLAKTTIKGENDPEKANLFRYWLFGGVMFDMVEQKDLTRDMKELAQMINVSALPLKNAIVREKGNATHTLFVFTDPLCPFCEKLEAVLDTLDDVRIYTFLTPIVSLHPNAREVAAQIYCAPNPQQALVDFMVHKKALPQTKPQCSTPIVANEKLMRELAIKGTPTLFFADGHRATGLMTRDALMERMNQALETQKLAQKLSQTSPTQH